MYWGKRQDPLKKFGTGRVRGENAKKTISPGGKEREWGEDSEQLNSKEKKKVLRRKTIRTEKRHSSSNEEVNRVLEERGKRDIRTERRDMKNFKKKYVGGLPTKQETGQTAMEERKKVSGKKDSGHEEIQQFRGKLPRTRSVVGGKNYSSLQGRRGSNWS